MKFPLYPLVLVAVVAILGGVALFRGMPASPHREEETTELDGDGDHDGDPVPTSDREESKENVTVSPTPPPPTPEPPAPEPSGYTMAQVTAHASADSCWTAIGGTVYDLTSWISQHPGGKSAILRLCGKDGTQAFNEEHGGQSRPERELASFKIGALI